MGNYLLWHRPDLPIPRFKTVGILIFLILLTLAQAIWRFCLVSWCRGFVESAEIERIIGRGAFGIVVKAFDEKLHRVVAIKVMNPELAMTSPPRKRFLREARTAAAMRHENIVGIYAVEEEPLPYLVMEYISGPTLQQKLDEKGPLELPDVLHIAQQLANALASAHAIGLIHRDIKPANILLEDGTHNRAKLTDFGLARAVDDASLTQSGMIAGTPLYMAPEQARGETLDGRADLFSLGTVLYQMAGGRPPFRAANTFAVLKRVCEDTPRPLQDVIPGMPDWICLIINRLLEKNPDDRFQSAEALAALLACCQNELQFNGKITRVADAMALSGAKTDSAQLAMPVAAPDAKYQAEPKFSLPLRRLVICLGIAALVLFGFFAINSGNPDGQTKGVTEKKSSQAVATTNPSRTETKETGWEGWPANAPRPAIAPFDAATATQHQQAWADYLKLPVKYTNTIGMKFVLIPPVEFKMGSTPTQIEAVLMSGDQDEYWQNVSEVKVHSNM